MLVGYGVNKMNEKFLRAINNQTWWDETITTTKRQVIIMGWLMFIAGFSVYVIINAILSE